MLKYFLSGLLSSEFYVVEGIAEPSKTSTCAFFFYFELLFFK